MKPLAVATALLLAGCDSLFGDPVQRAACETSATCAAGEYCAHTAEGSVCWPDAAPPTVSDVVVTCSTTPCLRDSVLSVRARASDAEELEGVLVQVDLGGQVRTFTESQHVGPGQVGFEVPLAQVALTGVAATAVVTVQAVDAAGNWGQASGAGVEVTRLREAVALSTASAVVPTAPAVTADGTVVVGGIDNRLHFLAPAASEMVAGGATLSGAIVQPPSIGAGAIWVAAGTRVYAVGTDGNSVLNGAGLDTGGAVAGPPAVTTGPVAVPPSATDHVAFAASGSGFVYAVRAVPSADGYVTRSAATDAYSSGPVLDGDGVALAVSSRPSPATATLRRFAYDGALTPGVTRDVGNGVAAPLALGGGATGSRPTWNTTSDLTAALVRETAADGASGVDVQLTGSAGGGAAVLANGDVAFCEADVLWLVSPSGAARWATPSLGGVGLTPMVLAGGPAAFLVPTRSGAVHAVSPSGQLLWTAALSPGVELREGNLHHVAGAPTSTAWFTSADGRLHGLIVDGWLDPAAPWPKAWHDPGNTSNAATPLPSP